MGKHHIQLAYNQHTSMNQIQNRRSHSRLKMTVFIKTFTILLVFFYSPQANASLKKFDPKTTPKFATANLAHHIHQWIAKTNPNSNSVYSPVSLYNVLASVYFGTGKKSETRKELQTHFNFKPEFNPEKYARRLGQLTQTKALETFNSYVFHKGNLRKDYAKELALLNFQEEKFKTFRKKEAKINKIVEKDTHGMIKEMFAPGSFDKTTSLVLLNTILFLGKWDESYGEFKKN